MDQTYTVKDGDTLSKVASQYGVNLTDISGYSSGNPDLIRPGEVLSVKTRTQAPANTMNATNLGATPYQVPPVTPLTGYDGLIKSSEAAVTDLGKTVDTGKEAIQTKYDRLGQLPTEQADAYKKEGVYDKQAAYSKAVNTINQKELAYQTQIDKIRNNNPTGQLEAGQQIQMDKITKDWAITKAALSISAAFLKDDFELAKTIVDDRISAETEGLQNELAGLEFFYSQNYNELSDERKNLLEFQMNQIADEKADKENKLKELGAIQLAAAENGAPSSVVVAIGKANDLTTAITAAGSWIDQTIDRKGGGSGFGTVDLAPEDERTLTGAGFSAQDIKDLQKFVAENGVNAALASSELSLQQKAAVKKVYNVKDYYTYEDVVEEVNEYGVDTIVKAMFSDDDGNLNESQLQQFAVEEGFGKGFLYKVLPGNSKKKSVEEYLASEKARQYAIDLMVAKHKKEGSYNE